MYAIIRTGGKQYRVEEGRTVTVERLPVEEGAAVELDNVLLIEDDGQVTVGSPTIEGARVLTEVESHGRDKKIVVFKYRAKVRTRKKTGHRQHFTRLAVTEILRPGQESKIAKPKRAPRRKAAAPTGEAATKPGAAAKAAPKTAARKPAAAKAKAETPTEKTARKPAAAKAKAETPTAKTAAPKRKTTRKKKGDDAADTPKASASAKSAASAKSTTAGEAEKKPARRRKATPPKATPPEAAGQDNKDEE